MKTLRIFGMVLFAVLMCANFVACGGGDENDPTINESPTINNGENTTTNNGEGTIIKTKKLIKILDDNEPLYTFSYENKEKISSFKYQESDYENVTIYNWNENSITAVDDKSERIYNLENDLITTFVEIYPGEEDDEWECFYNSSKQITKITEGEYTFTFNWEGDKLIEFIEEYSSSKYISTYKYSGKTTKGWTPIKSSDRVWNLFENNEIIYAHPELIGLNINQLPDEVEIIDYDGSKENIYFTYAFDNEGYVTERTLIVKRNNESYTYTYSYVWE